MSTVLEPDLLSKQLRILVFEDDEIEAALILDHLAASTYNDAQITRVDRVAAGLKKLAEEQWDIVLLDLNLPDGSGTENLYRLRTLNDKVPIVVLTNVEDDEVAMEMLREGAQDYLIKRFVNADNLSRAIRYALARHATEMSLRDSEKRYSLAVAGARDAIWDWDLDSDEIYFSPRWADILHLKPHQISKEPGLWFERVHEQDRAGVQSKLDAHLAGESEHFECEYRMLDADEHYLWILVRGVAVRDAEGRAIRVAGSLSDITDRKGTEQMLTHEAFHDPLTGLPNRNLFLDRLDLAIRQHRRDHDRKFAVVFLDMDRFKKINDTYGHNAGDQLLIGFSNRLSTFLRPGDSVARLGGDEFAILLMEISGLGEATRVAERIHEQISRKFEIDGKELYTSASIGIALSDTKYEHSSDLLRDADQAMYRSKREKRGPYTVFDTLMQETAMQRVQLETDLRTALTNDEMTVYYQPIVSLEQMRITGFEALMRWFHPVRGLIGPEEFIDVAEDSGSIAGLTWWIMEEACSQTFAWQRTNDTLADLSISVNVSSRMFSEPNFAERTTEILDRTQLSPHCLHLEITENALLQHEANTINELTTLQELGVKLHLDDFGTGYSSLSYLNLFSYDTIKIDRSFVNTGNEGPSDRRIIDALVGLAQVLKIGVIAEGVETQEQAQTLRDLECNMAQGYWFSKPLPSHSAEALLDKESKIAASSMRKLSQI